MHFFFLLINFHIPLELLVLYCGCFRIVSDLLCLCSVLGAYTRYIFHCFGSVLRMLPESYLYSVFSFHSSSIKHPHPPISHISSMLSCFALSLLSIDCLSCLSVYGLPFLFKIPYGRSFPFFS